jgi:protoheme IX farnesyltransferase
MNKIKNYIILSKPRLVYLLFFTGLAAMIIAGSIYGYDWLKTAMLSAAIILGVMGSNAMTNYIDRRIDGIMERTKKRPIPQGSIKPVQALIYASVLITIASALGIWINIWSGIFIFLGFIDSAIIYNALTKRRTPVNIILGAPAGGMPVLAGWIGIAGRLELLPVLLFILIMIWTPIHIWSLAYFYRDDYRKAGVPMLPVVVGKRAVFIVLAVLDILMVLFSIFIGIWYGLGPVYLAGAGIFGLAVTVFSLQLVIKERDRTAWLLFKLTSPYLAFVFILVMIEFAFLR